MELSRLDECLDEASNDMEQEEDQDQDNEEEEDDEDEEEEDGDSGEIIHNVSLMSPTSTSAPASAQPPAHHHQARLLCTHTR